MQMHEVIDGDHRSMNRYSSAQDAGYRKVASALKHYMNKLDRKHDIERMCKFMIASCRIYADLSQHSRASFRYPSKPTFVFHTNEMNCLSAEKSV